MRLWVAVLLVLVWSRAVLASHCTGRPDGEACLLVDGVTAGTCFGGACTRTFTVPAGEARTGTGTISSSGATVTGSGTVFTSELQVGDTLIAGSQRVAVAAIASNTSCSTVPAFNPAQSAASFTFANPVQKFLDESGNTLGLVDSRGLVAFGQTYADGPLTIVGLTETAAGTNGKDGSITPGVGGPASASVVGGKGGTETVQGAAGGASNFSAKAGGLGGAVSLFGGPGGANTSGSGQAGAGGTAALQGGDGGAAAGAGVGGNGGDARVSGGATGSGNVGNTFLCDLGGTLKIGGSGGAVGATQINCNSGAFTKIAARTVSNFPPANTAGYLKNDGSGNYSLSADLPNWVGAFTQANAGGL